jgi:pyruvate/2-oxoglutarate dehydrogenase complex dihydrolipoamide acyltransferase (E2) component
MDAGTIVEWRVQPGDEVHRGDVVAVVATDKADIDVEVFEAGMVQALLVPVGVKVPVGTPLCDDRLEAPAAVPVTRGCWRSRLLSRFPPPLWRLPLPLAPWWGRTNSVLPCALACRAPPGRAPARRRGRPARKRPRRDRDPPRRGGRRPRSRAAPPGLAPCPADGHGQGCDARRSDGQRCGRCRRRRRRREAARRRATGSCRCGAGRRRRRARCYTAAPPDGRRSRRQHAPGDRQPHVPLGA